MINWPIRSMDDRIGQLITTGRADITRAVDDLAWHPKYDLDAALRAVWNAA